MTEKKYSAFLMDDECEKKLEQMSKKEFLCEQSIR